MFVTKLTMATAYRSMLAVACFVVWAVLPPASAQDLPKSVSPLVALGAKPAGEKKAQLAKPAGPGTLLLARLGGLITLTPEGKEKGPELTAPKDTRTGMHGRLSPDGVRVAYLVVRDGPFRPPPRVGEAPEPWPFKVVVRTLGAADAPAVVDLPAHGLKLTWGPDGKRLLVTRQTMPGKFENVLLDPETGKTETLQLPAGVQVLDWSRDGKTFLVFLWQNKKYRLGLAAKGDKVRELTELKGRNGIHDGRFSPDGTKVLYTDADPAQKDANRWGVSRKPYLLDVSTRKREPLAEFPQNALALGVAWSPDGKRVAYTWKQLHLDLLKNDTLKADEVGIATEAFLIVADADGKNAKTVSSAKADNALNPIFGSIDWR